MKKIKLPKCPYFKQILLFALVLCLDVQLLATLNEMAAFQKMTDETTLFSSFRAEDIPLSLSRQWKSSGTEADFSEQVLTYLMTGETDEKSCAALMKKLQRKDPKLLVKYISYIDAVWKDIRYFPVPLAKNKENAQVSFVDSWMTERTYGGKRGHEGCDVMAKINERGIYPVISMTDGVVEKIGWLSAGGYRIGIRSPSGGYFYYAHLYDYAKDFQPGEQVLAGECLGFMGDSGYGDKEGTVGNFPVHLHVGIYINDSEGAEVSVNAYWILRYLENKKLVYDY